MTIQEIQDLRAQRINNAIIASGLSYSELEKITGISKSSIQRYATGETKKIPVDCIEKLAAAINVDTIYLMCWDTEQEKPAPTEDENELIKVVKELNSEFNFTNDQISRIASYMKFVGSEDSGKQ